MAFKIRKGGGGAPESPEALFLDTRTRKVPGLLAHQADVLRKYVVEQAVKKPDVALQLPTGSGKTLVGLLIPEWRRRKFGELCVYLCPTNQLVYQVAEQATKKYGLKVNAFVGPKADYSQDAKSEYLNGEAIAITSYSGLFNTHPFFENPSCIVLDDAHSAENYVASMWSLRIERYREAHAPLFYALINTLKSVLTAIEFQRLTGKEQSAWDRGWVEKIPTQQFVPLIPQVAAVLDEHVDPLDLRWRWALLKDNLDACHLYLSASEILIRPLLPPTFSHPPFNNAKHRLYMSATLGAGGELERVSGRRNIYRISAPAGWDKQGVGRRFFMFPGRSLNDEESMQLCWDLIRVAKRALVLVPDDRTANAVREQVRTKLGFPTFDAQAIEQSKEPFVSEPKAVAVVANRYDGIDFLDDECRLIMVLGLPRATNLQERFIVTRMGAVSLLNDRILTRTVQAFGRCTRSPTDYAAIVVLGEELFAYLMQKERRAFLHPELQAELQFGITQAKGLTAREYVEHLKLFLEQGKEWQEADENILDLRDGMTQQQLPGTAQLYSVAETEINYQESIWTHDYERALDACRTIIGELNDQQLKGYRALWGYLGSSAAFLADGAKRGRHDAVAKRLIRDAKGAAPTVSWLSSLASVEDESPRAEADAQAMHLVERLEVVLEGLGVGHDRRFIAAEKEILENLQKSDRANFERAHERLGWILGFDAGKKESTGSPDPWWIANDSLCFIFEDYSDAKPGGELDVKKARQVASHPNWVRENLSLRKDAQVFPVLISPIASVSRDALPHLKDVFLWNIDDFRSWARNALATVRELRRSFSASGDLVWRADAIRLLQEAKVAPKQLLELLASLPKASKY
jgi:hypothetical protein